MNHAVTLLGGLSLALAAGPRFSASAPAYRLESTVTLPGKSPAWDYLTVDSAGHRLFLGRRAAGVTVFDTARQKAVAVIDRSEGANIALLVPDLDRGFTANGDGSSTVFIMSTLKTLSRIKLGPSADAAFYEPVTRQVAFTLGDTRELVFMDAATATVTGRLTMDAEELEGTVADGRGFLFVNERDKNRLAKVDAQRRKVVEEWPIPGCEQPTGLAMDTAGRRLFIGCKGDHPVLTVLDSDTGRVVARQAIGRGNDGVVYDPIGKLVFTTNGLDGSLVIIAQTSADTYGLAAAVTTRPIARTLAFDPRTRKIYTATAEGIADPARPINVHAGPFYPNRYYDDTFTVLTYAPPN